MSIYENRMLKKQIPVAMRFNEAWVCGRSLAGIADSNPPGHGWLSLVVSQSNKNCKTTCRFRSFKVGCVCFQTHDFFPSVALRPSSGPPLTGLRDHTYWTHHTRYDSSGRGIGPAQRPVPDNTQHSQETDVHVPGGVRTYNTSKRPAAERRLRPHGYWDRPTPWNFRLNFKHIVFPSRPVFLM
jgi:hypothetical protein